VRQEKSFSTQELQSFTGLGRLVAQDISIDLIANTNAHAQTVE
jgi:hypothetical protein